VGDYVGDITGNAKNASDRTWEHLGKWVKYHSRAVLFLAILDPRVGHTMDVLSPFIPVLCHSN